jgi:hypothetical protein
MYSTHCPKCQVLEKKLQQKGIEYNVVTDTLEMGRMGIRSLPVLSVNSELLDFKKAIEWVNKQ